MTIVVATTSPSFGKIGRIPALINDRGWKLIRCDSNDGIVKLMAHASEVDFLVVGLHEVKADFISKATRLKGIHKHGTGLDNIDIPAAENRNIPVTITPGANTNAVAELALGHMLSLARDLPNAHRSVVDGQWHRNVGTELAGKTLGIVGLGDIGKRLAKKAQALDMFIVAADLYPDLAFAKENKIEFAPLSNMLSKVDFLSLHATGGKTAKPLIGAQEISHMKASAYILNLARGSLLDLHAVHTAIEQGNLRGAAIDAYAIEPPDHTQPAFSNPAIFFTPHIGASTQESVERMGVSVISNIDEIIASAY